MCGISFIFGFFYGFIFGFILKFVYSLYNKYNEYKDLKKIAINKIYNIISDKVFNLFYDDICKNNSDFKINGLEDLHDIQLLIESFEKIIKNHNNKFKISFIDNQCKIKLLDKNYINDENFIRVCEFFTKNNIELNIIVYETHNNVLEDINIVHKLE